MGEPAGIGLELLGTVWRELRDARTPFFLIGDPEALRAAAAAPLPVAVIAAPEDAAAAFPSALPVLPRLLARQPTPGRADAANAPAVLECIREGASLCLAGRAAGLVTLPIAKAPLYEAGFAFPGHTEFLAHLTDAHRPVMMLVGPSLRVALATIHTPYAAVPAALSIEGLTEIGRTVLTALQRDFAIPAPRLALAGLNPHAGEGGAIGREEIEILNPAAAALRAEGFDVRNAAPADSLFHAQARAGYDAVLAMTHDQGLIPVKTLHFWDAVNVTLGLPIVRTSPDHGVGFDIAGKHIARTDSLAAALRLASEMAARRADSVRA